MIANEPTTHSPPLTATVTHWQRFSTEDGPGIRTTLFFKGCPLHCRWCHNPECILPSRQLQWLETRCIRCQRCVTTCPNDALSATDTEIKINRNRCTLCSACAADCPTRALDMIGRSFTTDQLTRELTKDRAFYDASGGGVTLSGGEPLIQIDVAAELLAKLKQQNIHTAVDTCGLVAPDTFDRILPHTDLILFDLKHIDPEKHRELTGVTNERILENLIHLADLLRHAPAPKSLWLRTPLIPHDTDDEHNMRGIADFINNHLDPLVTRWDLCTFNNLCADKYRRLDMTWPYPDTPLIRLADLQAIERLARSALKTPDILHTSGMTGD